MGTGRADAGRIDPERTRALDPARAGAAEIAAFRRKIRFVFQDHHPTLNLRHPIRTCLR